MAIFFKKIFKRMQAVTFLPVYVWRIPFSESGSIISQGLSLLKAYFLNLLLILTGSRRTRHPGVQAAKRHSGSQASGSGTGVRPGSGYAGRKKQEGADR